MTEPLRPGQVANVVNIVLPDGRELSFGEWEVKQTYSRVFMPLETRPRSAAEAAVRDLYDRLIDTANELEEQVRKSRNRKHRRHRLDERVLRRQMRASMLELRRMAHHIDATLLPVRYVDWTAEQIRVFDEKGMHPWEYMRDRYLPPRHLWNELGENGRPW